MIEWVSIGNFQTPAPLTGAARAQKIIKGKDIAVSWNMG